MTNHASERFRNVCTQGMCGQAKAVITFALFFSSLVLSPITFDTEHSLTAADNDLPKHCC